MTTMTIQVTIRGLALPTDDQKAEIHDALAPILSAHAESRGKEPDVMFSFQDQRTHAASKSIPAALVITGTKVKKSLTDLLNAAVASFSSDQEVKLHMG